MSSSNWLEVYAQTPDRPFGQRLLGVWTRSFRGVEGFAVVFPLGRRLEYDVTNGQDQGTTNAVGFDGSWRDPAGYGLVVEVKTTDQGPVKYRHGYHPQWRAFLQQGGSERYYHIQTLLLLHRF